MATKSDRPGLLSKMALFVRNPTKDWSDLEKPDQSAESGYDKHALKVMIERKRQNDFVRKREFDQLRKLRSRETTADGGVARPSIFQTSVATDPDGRAVTLKKIDEIEAQMSKQWWKGKQDGAAPADAPADTEPNSFAPPVPVDPQAVAEESPPKPFETTQAEALQVPSSEFVETEMGAGMPPSVASSVPGLADRYEGADAGFSTSKLFAMEAGDMPTDPELEEAAIRFANGDDTGAETGLLQALRSEATPSDTSLSWVAALLDFYRATDQQEKFKMAVEEFSTRFDRMTPLWLRLQDSMSTSGRVSMSAAPQSAGNGLDEEALWVCPPELTAQSMEQLRELLGSYPPPWLLDWSRLTHVAPGAMPLLAGFVGSLCEEPVALRFSDSANLAHVLRTMAPSGQRGVDPAWWTVRLNALRVMQMQDEFELSALDYCVTYEVSPPAWVPARCQFESVNLLAAARGGDFSRAMTAPGGLENTPFTSVELRGEVLGDATQTLVRGEGVRVPGVRIVVSCHALLRVDFSAAGSILNWVAVRQAEGCHVQFRDVHRLVAAFFNVIGINEHARVVPRSV
jgi:hypothetical protein